MSIIERTGMKAESIFLDIGFFVKFIMTSLWKSDKRFWGQWRYSVVQQGTHSLWLVLLSSSFIGMVLALQGFYILNRFGADQALGQLIALTMIRELGPVMCSLFFIGQSCSTITAELALMRITMQIDSLEVIGVDPRARLIWPRLCAVIFVAPLLVSIFIVSAILSGSMVSIGMLGVDYGAFWSNILSNVDFYQDVCVSLFKGLVFFVTAVMIAIYQGYCVKPQVEAVAEATTRTVVIGSVLTLALDFILTSFTMTVY
jgi:phospholipid/cholesterol/gamma-HCH transport system permease protein